MTMQYTNLNNEKYIKLMNRKNNPDYGFTRGLRIEINDMTSNGVVRREHTYSREDLGNTPLPDEHLKADVAERMANPRLIRGLGGVALEMALVGPSDSDEVMFVGYGWGGNVRHPVAVYEAQTLAASNPDKQLVFMNTFGTGRSSLLPKSVEKEVRQKGTYVPMGEYVASTLDQVIDGRDTHLRGHSLGARIVTGTAPHLENPADSMILNDPTGTRKMGLFGIASKFAIKEGRHLGAYMDAGFDSYEADLQKNPVKSSVWNTVEGTKGGWRQQFLVDPSGLKLPAFETDLVQATPHVERLIRVISPELSELNKKEDVADILGVVRDVDGRTALLEHFVLRDHTHSAVTLPQILARLYEEV